MYCMFPHSSFDDWKWSTDKRCIGNEIHSYKIHTLGKHYLIYAFLLSYLHIHGNKDLTFPISLIKNCIKPKYTEMTRNIFRGFYDKELPKEYWSPYYEEIANRTINAAKDNEKVVLTHATYQQKARDVVIETLVKGGIPRNNITIIELLINEEIKLRGLYHRQKRLAEQNGITLEEFLSTLKRMS